MPRTIRRLAVAVLAAGLLALTAQAASASVTFDPLTGNGFVGKGDVQTAFGWSNATMQTNHTSITFSSRQLASQALSSDVSQTASQVGSQSASQTGTTVYSQTATQDVTETLSCNKNGAPVQNVRHGVRSGERSDTVTDTVYATRTASRDGSRDGVRYGSRAGTLVGSLNSALNIENRKTGQYTGWYLKGYNGSPQFVPSGTEQFGDPTFGAWSYGDWTFGDFVFPEYNFADPQFAEFDLSGDPVWGPWDTDNTNADPDVCVNNGNGITNFNRTITEGPVVEGAVSEVFTEDAPIEDAVVEGAITEASPIFGPTQYGAVTGSGPANVYATYAGVSKLLPIAPIL
jgi:hypothetical protein